MLNVKNPLALFVFMWLFVLYIYSKQYSLLLTPLTFETIGYVIMTCLSFVLSFYCMQIIFLEKKFVKNNVFEESASILPKLRRIFKIWVFFTLLEITYFRGLPLLSVLLGGEGKYTELGIPSLHGFLNAMVITLSNYCFYYYIKNKDKKFLYFFILCVLWPILLVTRQMLLSMVVQATVIYIMCNSIRISSILKVIFSGFLIVCLFGLVGDLRSGGDSFLNLAQPSSDYPTWLPSGVLWVYIYMVSPLNNVNFNIHIYPDFNFSPSVLISNFFPSFIRTKIFAPSDQFNFQLVNEYLNVSTMFPSYLEAFGRIGSLIFYFLLGLLISFVYFKFKSKNSNVKWLFILAVIFHNLIFSVFVDFFFNLVFLFQFVLHFYIAKPIKFSSNEN